MNTNETNEKSAVKIEQKFKHGDKIIYKANNVPELRHGKVYVFDRYHPTLGYVIIQGLYDNGDEPMNGEYAASFELFEAAKPVVVKPKDNRKKYTLVYSEMVGAGMYRVYLPRIKKIKVKDIAKYLAIHTDLDVQYVIKGHVTLV